VNHVDPPSYSATNLLRGSTQSTSGAGYWTRFYSRRLTFALYLMPTLRPGGGLRGGVAFQAGDGTSRAYTAKIVLQSKSKIRVFTERRQPTLGAEPDGR
jgi:hypothetical protein